MVVREKHFKRVFNFLLWGWVVCATLGQLLRLEFADVVVHFSDVVIGVISLLWVVCFLMFRIRIWEHWLFRPLVVFVGPVTLSWVINYWSVSNREFAVGSMYFVRWLGYANLVFVLQWTWGKKTTERVQLVRILKYSLMSFAALGFLQYLFFYDFRVIEHLGWDPHLHRLAGTFLDPGYAGLWLLLGLLLVSDDEREVMKRDQWWSWEHGLFLLLTICLGLTFSRATYLALIISVGFYSYLNRAWMYAGLVVLILGLVIGLAPKPGGEGVKLQRTSTIQLRLINWSQATAVIQDHLVFGVGFNRYRYVQREYNFVSDAEWKSSHAAAGVDNSWLFLWVVSGVGGVLTYLWLWKDIVVQVIHSTLSEKKKLGLPNRWTVIAMFCAVAVHGMFHNSWFYAPVLGWMSMMVALIDMKTVIKQG